MFVHLKIYTLKSNPEGIIIDGIILVHFQGKPFNITVIYVYAPMSDAKEAEVDWLCEDLQHCLELTPKKKKSPFHPNGFECKSRKSRVTQNNRQVLPYSTK